MQESKPGFESPNLTWAASAHKGCPSLWYRQGRMQRCLARALAGLRGLWDGRARMQCRPKASRASRVLPLLVARVAPGVREGCFGGPAVL